MYNNVRANSLDFSLFFFLQNETVDFYMDAILYYVEILHRRFFDYIVEMRRKRWFRIKTCDKCAVLKCRLIGESRRLRKKNCSTFLSLSVEREREGKNGNKLFFSPSLLNNCSRTPLTYREHCLYKIESDQRSKKWTTECFFVAMPGWSLFLSLHQANWIKTKSIYIFLKMCTFQHKYIEKWYTD